jgi:hypothetical protein
LTGVAESLCPHLVNWFNVLVYKGAVRLQHTVAVHQGNATRQW